MSSDDLWRDAPMYRDLMRAERSAGIYERHSRVAEAWSLEGKAGEERANKAGLKTVKERVTYLLRKYPETRNSDLLLIVLYLREFTELGEFIKYIPHQLLRKHEGVTESVRRARQQIQAGGQYLPTDPGVLEARRRKERRLRRLLGGGDL
ncbi:MAG: hypothetical protein QXX81_05380 [Zestosphaera sp.]